MAGAYCKFCDHRCFVERVIPSGPQMGWTGHLATCAAGKEYDRNQTGGFDSSTAINPVTHPRQAGLVRRLVQLRKSQQTANDLVQQTGNGVDELEGALSDLADDAFTVWSYLTSGRTVFGVCGARLHQQSTYDNSMYLIVCTKEPGHGDHGDREHEDGTRNGAPAAKWVNPTAEEYDAMYHLETHPS
jgi:hypothetical protein